MSLAGLVKRRNVSAFSFGAMRTPTTNAELRGSAYNHAMLNLRYDSEQRALDIAMGELFTPIYDTLQTQTGETDLYDLAKTRGHLYTQNGYRPDKAPARSLGEGRYMSVMEDLEKRGVTNFPGWADVEALAAQKANAARDQFMEDQMFTVAKSPLMSTFAGTAGASMTDPLVLTSVAMTLPFGLATSATRMALFEGTVGLATEIPIEMQTRAWHLQRDIEYGPEQSVANLAAAFILPSAFGVAFQRGFKYFANTPTQLFDGPGADIKRLRGIQQVARRKRVVAAYNKRHANKTPVDDYDGEQLLSHTYSFEQQATPWSAAPTLLTRTLNAAALLPEGDPRYVQTLAAARDLHLHQTNPAVASRVVGTAGPEGKNYVYSPAQTNQMHYANMYDAVRRLQSYETPSPVYKQELSMEIFSMPSDANHVTVARRVDADGLKFNLRSAPYREIIAEQVYNAVAPGLRRQVANAGVGPEPPAVRRPSTKPEQMEGKIAEQAKQLDEITTAHKASVRTIKQELRNLERRTTVTNKRDLLGRTRKEFDQKIKDTKAKYDVGIDEAKAAGATPAQIRRAQNNKRKAVEKLRKQKASEVKRINKLADKDALAKQIKAKQDALTKAEDAYNARMLAGGNKIQGWHEGIKMHSRADTVQLRRQELADARTAQRQLDELEEGRIPKEFNEIRDALHESISNYGSNIVRFTEQLNPQARKAIQRMGEYRFYRNVEDYTKALDDRITASQRAMDQQALDELRAEVDRIDTGFKVTLSDTGEVVTVARLTDDLDQMDDALTAMKTECNTPAGADVA